LVTNKHVRLIPGRLVPDTRSRPDPQVVKEWSVLARTGAGVPDLSRKLFLRLRKFGDEEALTENLLGLQQLAFDGGAEGAALLAAYLDVTTAGARLLPFVQRFTNTRRLNLLLQAGNETLGQTAQSWLPRARSIQTRCTAFLKDQEHVPPADAKGLVGELRACLECMLVSVMNGGPITAEDRQLLVDLLHMETDAWQERVSRLAGLVNPYRAEAVTRVLPILSLADASIRDLRQLIGWVQAGQDAQAFSRNGFRALEVLDNQEFQIIYNRLRDDFRLKALHEMHMGGRDNPLKTSLLAHAVARLMALESRVREQGLDPQPLSLVSAVAAVQQFTRNSTVAIPLDMEQEAILAQVLREEEEREREIGADSKGPQSWSLQGVELDQGQLIIKLEDKGKGLAAWPSGLPTPGDLDPLYAREQVEALHTRGDESEEAAEDEKSNAAIKQLVMSNIMSTSTTLGFLRNPKVVAIPGLVADIATRTRNPQIIETIATDRTLYTGFANRDVPLVCLRSPCNVSPKTLRKFIHVKYVSKVDLKRMALDKAGMRKEVVREIQRYLDSLT